MPAPLFHQLKTIFEHVGCQWTVFEAVALSEFVEVVFLFMELAPFQSNKVFGEVHVVKMVAIDLNSEKPIVLKISIFAAAGSCMS